MEEKYMRRAIELARNGIGRVNPNPLVGAVIVKDGEIIAEGYHAEYGGLHAERNAFKNLTGGADGADIYVTLSSFFLVILLLFVYKESDLEFLTFRTKKFRDMK